MSVRAGPASRSASISAASYPPSTAVAVDASTSAATRTTAARLWHRLPGRCLWRAGSVVAPPIACVLTETNCGGVCVDLMIDPNNCGTPAAGPIKSARAGCLHRAADRLRADRDQLRWGLRRPHQRPEQLRRVWHVCGGVCEGGVCPQVQLGCVEPLVECGGCVSTSATTRTTAARVAPSARRCL